MSMILNTCGPWRRIFFRGTCCYICFNGNEVHMVCSLVNTCSFSLGGGLLNILN
jgi:hypothetical protein